MENEKIENRVILTLDDYLKLRDLKMDRDKNINELISLLFNCFELNNDKNNLAFDKYDVKSSVIKNLLKEIEPEKYQELLNVLMKEEEE